MTDIQFTGLRPQQKAIWRDLKRFNCILAHRRLGKTVLAVAWLIHECLTEERKRPRVAYMSPTYAQSKKVAWMYCHAYTEKIPGVIHNESELKVTVPNGGVMLLGSADNPQSALGQYFDAVVLDEPAQMNPIFWSQVIRPALSDREGKAMFIGTPQGRHGPLYEAWVNAEDDPLWSRVMYKASETGVIAPDELDAARRSMSVAEYQQEYECSFDAAVRGSYWGPTMTRLEADGHLDLFSHDPGELVHCGFDLGMNDSTAIWFWQYRGDRKIFIEYIEFQNTGLPDIIAWLRKKRYNYGAFVFPHDVRVRSLSTGKTREQTLQSLGVDVVVAPKLPVIDAIEQTRLALERCYFDRKACQEGIEALRQYRSDWSDSKGVLALKPLHDWSSHGADAMRYICTTPDDMIQSNWSTLDYSYMDAHAVR